MGIEEFFLEIDEEIQVARRTGIAPDGGSQKCVPADTEAPKPQIALTMANC